MRINIDHGKTGLNLDQTWSKHGLGQKGLTEPRKAQGLSQ